MAKSSKKLAELVNRMPDPDGRGLYCTDIDKEKIESAIAEIHEGGRRNILGIIDMLVPPGKGDDVKAHYALHVLGLHVCKLDDDEPRRRFAKALASQLGGDRPKAVQAYLVQELQAFGGKEVVETLGRLLTDEELCQPAAMALVAIGDRAAEHLRSALPRARGKCRLTVVQNLGVVRDAASAYALREAVGDEDQAVRIAATWALGNIGEAGSVDLLLRTADKTNGWERIQATKACLLLAEKLLASGRKNAAVRIYTHLRNTRTDPAEHYVRDAAKSALAEAG
ncbi:MAG: HEAT repeat domain-containing protein [Planctomycetes bacterium]|nr:HEAT repeat domain-containing protein [Planctomycetota bacterium]